MVRGLLKGGDSTSYGTARHVSPASGDAYRARRRVTTAKESRVAKRHPCSFVCALSVALTTACGGTDLTCGDNTERRGSLCVGRDGVDASAPPDGSVADAPPAPPPPPADAPPGDARALGPPFESIDVTHLAVRYDLSQPALAGNNLPISLGVTARDRGAPNPRRVIFTIDLVEELPPAATAEQRMGAARCALGFFDVTVTPNGREEVFQREFPVPRECASPAAGQATRAFNLAVVVDSVAAYHERPIFLPFTERERADPMGYASRCRNGADPMSPARGCVSRVLVGPSAGVNVANTGLTPDSRVAVLWPRPEPEVGSGVRDPSVTRAARPTSRPIEPGEDALVTVNMSMESFGLNPYAHGAADEALPGAATIAYTIAPVTAGTDPGLPLTMRARDEGGVGTVPSHDFNRLGTAGSSHRVHDLFPTDAVYDALTTGAWRRETQFRVRGCAQPSFREAGNQGNQEAAERPNDLSLDNCRDFTVRLVRAQPDPSAATSSSLDYNWTRLYGNPATEALQLVFDTRNSWSLSRGAQSNTFASIRTIGLVPLDVFFAYANAEARRELTGSFYDVGVRVFGIQLLRRMATWGTVSITPYNETWSVSQEKCIDFSYTPILGVVIGLNGCVSGSLGMQTTLNLTGALGGTSEFPSAFATMNLTPTGRPFVEAGATATASISVGAFDLGGLFGVSVFEGSVRGDLDLISFSMPVSPGLRFGWYRPSTGRPAGELKVVGFTTVTQALTYLGGQVTVAGTAACATYTWFSLSRGFYTETVCAWSGESLMWSFTPTTSSSTLYDTSRSLLSLY